MRCPPTCCFSFSQLAAVGHDGSDGRTRRTEGTAAGAPARTTVVRYDQTTERTGIDPTYLKNIRLFISKFNYLLLLPKRLNRRTNRFGVFQISLVKRLKLDVMKNVTEQFYDNARVLCAIVKGPKHTVEIQFQFANPWPEGQGYYLVDENGKERRNNGQLWEDFRTALRQAHLVAERL
jgi:hypothetical protein